MMWYNFEHNMYEKNEKLCWHIEVIIKLLLQENCTIMGHMSLVLNQFKNVNHLTHFIERYRMFYSEFGFTY